MIRKKTVFVLGAGASISFKYPSGEKLVDIICKNFGRPDTKHVRELMESNRDFSATSIFEFRNQLLQSGDLSVDAFLEQRPEFIEIGKHAIAQALIPFENNGVLFLGGANTNWYKYLFDKLSRRCTFINFRHNEIAFITFNYDRSLEQFLFIALKNKYGKNYEDCKQVFNMIPIIHVYGRLDYLPHQKEGGRSYHPDYTSAIIKRSAKEINILSEEVRETEDFKKAYKLLVDADVIYFLGFGYNKTNLERLSILTVSEERLKPIYGTIYNIMRAELLLVKKYFEPIGITFCDETWDVLRLLRHYLEFEY